MFRVFASISLLSIALSLGCSGGADPNANNANAIAESPFAHITDANEALAEGNRLSDENDINLAIAAYQRAIELNPDLAEAHFQLGIAYSLQELRAFEAGESSGKKPNSQKAFEKAVEAYKKLLDAAPKDDAAWFNLGRAYTKLLKDQQAEDAFREAVKLKPDDTEYQTELGAVLIKLAKYHEAIGPLKKALELDPTNSRAEEMLEDAQAGRQRLDYTGPKNANSAANSNANSASANGNAAPPANTNSSVKPPPANARPSPSRRPANKPN